MADDVNCILRHAEANIFSRLIDVMAELNNVAKSQDESLIARWKHLCCTEITEGINEEIEYWEAKK